MKTIIIKEPFYGAGSPKWYNWVKDGYDMKGVGINTLDLTSNKELKIVVEKIPHIIETTKIIDFVKKYRSFKVVKNSDVTVGVFSVSLF